MFSFYPIGRKITTRATLKLSSADTFNFDKAEILSSGKRLRRWVKILATEKNKSVLDFSEKDSKNRFMSILSYDG